MNLVEIRGSHTKWAINQNPVMITIQRKVKERKKGYIKEEEYTVGPFMVRIYIRGTSLTPTIQVPVQGERMTDRYYSLLADYNADIRADTDTVDSFVLGDGVYKIIGVWPQTIHNKIVGYQCDVERVT